MLLDGSERLGILEALAAEREKSERKEVPDGCSPNTLSVLLTSIHNPSQHACIHLISVISEVDAVSRFDLADLPTGNVAVKFFQEQFGSAVFEIANSVNDARRHDEADLRHHLFQADPVEQDIIHRQPVREAVQDKLQQMSPTNATIVFCHHSDSYRVHKL